MLTQTQFQERSLGNEGAVYVTDTTETKGAFCALQALEDTVISAMTANDWEGTLTSIPVPAGATIVGQINSFTLTSGKVLAYKR